MNNVTFLIDLPREKDIECRIEVQDETGLRNVVRVDTGEVIEVLPSTDEYFSSATMKELNWSAKGSH